MKRAEAFPSRYLNVKGLRLFPNGERIWTIRDVRKENVEAQDGVVTDKNVMYFTEEESTPMVLNSTNWDILADAWGDESDGWIGEKIQLYVDANVRNPSGGPPGGLRLKIPAGARVAQVKTTAAAALPVVAPAPNPAIALLSWKEAQELGQMHGVTYSDLVTYLKAMGREKGYNDVRDSAMIRDYIDANSKVGRATAPAEPKGEECPF